MEREVISYGDKKFQVDKGKLEEFLGEKILSYEPNFEGDRVILAVKIRNGELKNVLLKGNNDFELIPKSQ